MEAVDAGLADDSEGSRWVEVQNHSWEFSHASVEALDALVAQDEDDDIHLADAVAAVADRSVNMAELEVGEDCCNS